MIYVAYAELVSQLHNFMLFHSHCRQFGQFDYSQQGYDYNQGVPGYGGPTFAGSIMTPAASYTDQPDTQGGDNFEDEPPLMEGVYVCVCVVLYCVA